MPAPVPVTTPVVGPTVTVDVPVVVQVPPAGLLLSVVVAFTQMLVMPVIVAGSAFTVIIAVRWQPVDNVYEMVVVPAATAFTKPDPETIVAVPVVLLVQVPGPGLLVSVVVLPSQSISEPAITAGSALTVTMVDVVHPVPSE